jgi:hypothetical protein
MTFLPFNRHDRRRVNLLCAAFSWILVLTDHNSDFALKRLSSTMYKETNGKRIRFSEVR